MYNLPEESELFASDARGIYIPQHFAESVQRDKVSNVKEESWTILEAGPYHELYWDVWCEVLDDAKLTDSNGRVWSLWQDGDLWLVPDDVEFGESE